MKTKLMEMIEARKDVFDVILGKIDIYRLTPEQFQAIFDMAFEAQRLSCSDTYYEKWKDNDSPTRQQEAIKNASQPETGI